MKSKKKEIKKKANFVSRLRTYHMYTIQYSIPTCNYIKNRPMSDFYAFGDKNARGGCVWCDGEMRREIKLFFNPIFVCHCFVHFFFFFFFLQSGE